MKKLKAKKLIATGVAVTLAASLLTGCGNKDNASNGGTNGGKNTQNDPELAKIGVFNYVDIDLGLDTTDYSIVSSAKVDNGLAVGVRSYYFDETTYSYENQSFVCTIDENGKLVNTLELMMPDFSEYRPEGYTGQAQDDYAILFSESEVSVDTTDIAIDDDIYVEPAGNGNENYSLDKIFIKKDGSSAGLIQYYCSFTDESGNYNSVDINFLCGWDTEGNLTYLSNLTENMDSSWIYISDAVSLSDGSMLLIVNGEQTQFCIYDNEGNLKTKKSASDSDIVDSIRSISATKDDKVIIVYNDMSNNYNLAAAYIDLNTLMPAEALALPQSLEVTGYNCLVSGVSSDFVISDTKGVGSFNVGDTEINYFMDYVNSDLDADSIETVIMIDDEHFIGQYYDSSNYEQKVSLFTYVDPSTIADKQVVTLATYWTDSDVRSKVIEFNKKSNDYRIILTSYSQYASDDDYSAGYTRLNNDIIAGNAPDIIIADTSMIDYNAYANKNMLVDFDELFENDEELKNNTYLTNVFDAYAIKGKHYIGVYAFEYYTFRAHSDYVGDSESWTISEFIEASKNFPADSQLIEGMTKEDFLYNVITFDGSEFVDLENGKCDFNSEDFINLLEYSASLPEEYDWSNLGDDYWSNYQNAFRSGKTILNNTTINNLRYYHNDDYEYFDGKAVNVGFPSRTGNSQLVVASSTPIAIFDNGNVDGAWSFVREFFKEDFQNEIEWDIPVLESSFDKWANKAMERNYYEYDGQIEYYDDYYYIDGIEQIIPLMTQAEVDEIKETIKSCTKTAYTNTSISEIIEEEVSAFYSGQKSATEVAGIIQSRVQIYINENQ